MRKKNCCRYLLASLLAMLLTTACEKDGVTVTQIKVFISLANDDGYNVLKEYPLKVTSFLNSFHQANPSVTKFQFRLQFLPDGNVTPPSPLTSSMWNIFAGDETQKAAYRPTLSVKYHYRDQ